MKNLFTKQNIIFSASLALVVLTGLGIIPRFAAFLVLGLYLFYLVFAPLNRGVEIFLRSIPIFIALPITESFDNFNMWRLLLLVLFLKWAWEVNIFRMLRRGLDKLLYGGLNIRKYSIEFFGILFFVFAGISVFVALDTTAAVKRLIYLANGAFLFIITVSLIRSNKNYLNGFLKNFAYSGILVVVIGFVQFISAYFTQPWIFHYWWGQVVSLNLYGREWADIVTFFGNTWFSYSGDTLRLRMFSIFPDSHSFPLYVIMTIPGLLYMVSRKLSEFKNYISSKNYKFKLIRFFKSRRNLFFVFGFALMNLALILSGTRGIWVSGPLAALTFLLFWKFKTDKRFTKVATAWLTVFLIMFAAYFLIVSFPQFQDTEFSSSATVSRIKSITDFGEISNKGRINIWQKTLSFTVKSPVWGTGIGNYPLVLYEPQSAMQAGASAHNIYLHIASTIGIFGLLAFLGYIFEIVRRGIIYIKNNPRTQEGLYAALTLFALAWVGAYLMTDATLYDGRALLAFMAFTGIITGLLSQPIKRTNN